MSKQQKSQGASKPKRKARLRWGRVLILILPFLAAGFLIWTLVQLLNPLSLKGEVYSVQVNSEFDPYGNIESLFMDSSDNVGFSGNVDMTVMGDYDASYQYKGKTYDFTVRVADIEGPEMVLKDISTDTVQTLTAGDFIESISDDSSYNVMLEGDQGIGKSGTFPITISAKDQYGNVTTETATLTRTKDSTAPVLEEFEDSIDVLQGSNFSGRIYAVSDEIDPNPSSHADISQVDINTPGQYQAVYTTRDRSGNEATYTQTVNVIENPDLGKKVVYLTFDDGPSENTTKIVDILRQYGVVGTFFVTGGHDEYNDAMNDIVESGSTIALHTYSHVYSDVYSSTDAYFADLQKISDLVQDVTGVKAKVIRFPGGSSNMVSADYTQGIMSELVTEVQQKGYQYFDWNVDSTDASGNDVPVDTIVSNACDGIGMDDVVILFHDAETKNTTVEALPQIIQAYKDAGYVFKGLTLDSYPVHHRVQN